MRFESLDGLLWAVCWAQGVTAQEEVQEPQWKRAIPVGQMSRRQGYQGGWPQGLNGSKCADGLVQCSGVISNPSCCPARSTCEGTGEQYCCPEGTNCQQYVRNFPQCANPEHTLYMLTSRGTYFCCPEGEFGVLPLQSYGGFCMPEGAAIAPSRIATKATEAKTTFQATTRTTRTTVFETTLNGAITTVTSVVTTGRATVTVTSPVFGATNVPAGGDDSSRTTSSNRNTPTDGANSGNNSGNNNGNNSGAGGSSISAGAIAGIVIGALAVVAIFTLAWVLYRRHNKPAPVSHPSPMAGTSPAPNYSQYAPPPHQDKPEVTSYPIPVGPNSPAPSQAAPSTHFSGQSPVQGTIGTHSSGYETYGPHRQGGAVEVQGQNTWDGRAEMGSGR